MDPHGHLLPGVVVVCYSSGPTGPFVTTTGNTGEFAFARLPPGTYTLVAALQGYEEFVHSPIALKDGEEVGVPINLKLAGYAETVQVVVADHANDPPALEKGEFSSNILDVLPLPSDRFQESLPLLPGVVRDPRGRISFNGTRSSQSTLLVNGANVTDPLTGEFAFELPLKAVETVQVYTLPYSAEFGRVTGAVTSVLTRAGDDHWDVDFGDPIPSIRFRDGTIQGINSATPRIQVSGPLRKGKAWISQGVSYRFIRSRVRDTELTGEDEEIAKSFDTFTQLDLNLGPGHTLTTTFSYFPGMIDNLGLDTLHAAAATPDAKSYGWNFAVADEVATSSDTLWETQLAVRSFDVAVRPKGQGPARLTVSALLDDYFNELNRESAQAEFNMSRTHFASEGGAHVLKVGTNLYYTSYGGTDHSGPIDVVGADGRILRTTDFRGNGNIGGWDLGVAGYFQDQWRPSSTLGVDLGLRYDYERITNTHHISPRVGFAYSPWQGGHTVLKGGFGVFFDQFFVHADSFTRFQQRVETFFGPDGNAVGPPLIFQNRVDPEGLDLPRSTMWNVEVNRQFGDDWMLRVNYRERRGSGETVVDRLVDGPGGPMLLLSSRGGSTSKEFDVTARWSFQDDGELFFSFSKIRTTADLNNFGTLYGNLREPILLANEESLLPFDVPERLLAWGVVHLPKGIVVVPAVEWRTGFPFTVFNENYTVAGERNRGGRFPDFLSADLRVTKEITVVGKRVQVGVQIFNLTGHFNPRDVQSNLASPSFGQFRNSIGFSTQLKLGITF